LADKLYLIRHGRTAFNKDGRLRAHKDVPLDSVGRADATRLGCKLAKIDPDIDCIYASDLSRSRDTATLVARCLDKPDIEIRPELRPWHLGTLAGQKVTAVLPLLNYYQDHPDKKVARGEAYNDFFARWVKFLREQIAETRGEKYPDAVIVHARHMLSLDAALRAMRGEKVDTAKIPPTGGPQPGAVVLLTLGKTIGKKEIIAGQGESAKVS
jgi:broad specificity phosphatase PhoE